MPAPGDLLRFGAPRRIVGDAAVGPGIGRRLLQAAALAACWQLADVTLVALARTGISPRGGQELLLRSGCTMGVALEVAVEEDESEIGQGPLEIVRAMGFARAASLGPSAGARPAVRTDQPVLASLLLPAGVAARSFALAARYRGSDLERLAIQDAVRLAELLQSALSPS